MIEANGTSVRSLVIVAGTLATLSAGAPGAQGQSGGAFASAPPIVSGVTCSSRCAGLDRVKPGSILHISGSRMESVRKVIFLGRKGSRDDRKATVIRRDATGVDVRVPRKTRTGKVRVINGDGNRSRPSPRSIKLVRPGTKGKRLEARAESRRVFVFDGSAKPALRFFVGGRGAAQVTIRLARKGDPVVLASWTQGDIPSGSIRTVEWDGRVNGLQAGDGKYEFRLSASGSGARSAQAEGRLVETFSVLSYRFPINGPHTYGTGAGSFGSGRDYGAHQGQDVFAQCGTQLLAARGGVVVKRGIQDRAGNYLVIHTDGGDHVYMHMRDVPLVGDGAVVTTGQPIGEVGQTGRADGCHLHFEVWPDGWQVGQPVDPRPLLLSWDR